MDYEKRQRDRNIGYDFGKDKTGRDFILGRNERGFKYKQIRGHKGGFNDHTEAIARRGDGEDQ